MFFSRKSNHKSGKGTSSKNRKAPRLSLDAPKTRDLMSVSLGPYPAHRSDRSQDDEFIVLLQMEKSDNGERIFRI